MHKKIYLLFVVCLGLNNTLFPQTINPYQYSIQKKVICNNGAVVSAHPLASMVGKNMLQQGGNAVDAAIATQLALAVVYPGAGHDNLCFCGRAGKIMYASSL